MPKPFATLLRAAGLDALPRNTMGKVREATFRALASPRATTPDETETR